TTAIAMAAALGASHAEIYSDVDGVYSADPRVAEDARHLPELTYDEMGRMAAAGAKVLHAKAVELARDAGIAIRARSTFRPGKETHVHDAAAPARTPRAVVGARGLAEIALPRRAFTGALALLAEAGLDVPFSATGDRVALALRPAHAPDWPALRRALEEAHEARIMDARGTVTIVGGGRAPVAAAVEELVPGVTLECAEGEVRLRMDDASVDDAVRVLHARLVGGEDPPA
ncbi:MAG: aspartate kinase, partial [Myxococcota bacterium]